MHSNKVIVFFFNLDQTYQIPFAQKIENKFSLE